MRELKYIIILYLTCVLSCESGDYSNVTIPSVVLNKFQANFSYASEVDWSQNQNTFEVEFETDGRQYAIMFNSRGDVVKHKHEIQLIELPVRTRDILRNTYEDSNFDEIERIKIKNKIFYQLEIEQPVFDKEVVVDQSGETVKEFSFWE